MTNMKKLILSFVTLYFVLGMTAQEVQDTTYWKKNGDFTVNFSQVSFSNWAAGGKNSVSGVALFNYGANYLKDRLSWDNSLNLGYGLLKEGSDELIKSEDKMEFNSKAGYRMAPESKWFFSGLLGFRSQFANGYKYPDTDNRISALFAPAYLNFALGADYKPSDRFSLFLSPLGSKFTFVADDVLAPLFGLETGKNMRAELGGTLRSELKLPLVTNVDMVAALGLFSNYLEKPQNVDVNWDLRINMKINKFLSANLITNMIYDDNIKIDGKNSLVQWKQLFGVGFSYKF